MFDSLAIRVLIELVLVATAPSPCEVTPGKQRNVEIVKSIVYELRMWIDCAALAHLMTW